MPDTRTFGDMQDRIETETHRGTVDTARVQEAILGAIDHFKYERFDWNEGWMEFTTVIGQDDYADGAYTRDDGLTNLPWDAILEIDSLKITVNSTIYDLRRVGFREIENMKSSTTHQGYPDYYSIHRDLIRVYPIPISALRVEGPILEDINYNMEATSPDSFTSAWFTKAEEMVRCRAKAYLYSNFYNDPQRARDMFELSNAAFNKLKGAYEKKVISGGSTRAWY